MSELPPQTPDLKISPPIRIPTEAKALRNEWVAKEVEGMQPKSFRELRSLIQSYYQEIEPLYKEILEEKGIGWEENVRSALNNHFSEIDFTALRKELKMPKWVSLAEIVAFIKTVHDLGAEDIRKRYAHYCATSMSLDDMRNILNIENDVKPTRIDSDIYNQSPERSRSVVEITSNAIDALATNGNTIGRFGVGFYQILSHLSADTDLVIVTTGNNQDGFNEIAFRNHQGDMQVHLEPSGNSNPGTKVELVTSNFPQEEAMELIRKHFAYNHVARVYCNGELVNNLENLGVNSGSLPVIEIEITDNGFMVRDEGVGMGPQVILEKLLVPKFSGKKPVNELMQSEVSVNYLTERRKVGEEFACGKVVLNVGGVMVEQIEVSGINSLKTLVVDLPPFTMLGEERNKIAVDEVTIKAVFNLIDQACTEQDITLINSLAPVVSELQDRSTDPREDKNMLLYLQKSVEKIIVPGTYCLPNIQGFERLQVSNTILLDPRVKQTNFGKIPGFEKPNLTGDGKLLLVAPLKSQVDQPVIEWKNRVILSGEIYEYFKGDPTLINLYLGALGEGDGSSIRQISTRDNNLDREDKSPEIKDRGERYKDFHDYVCQNFDTLGLPNLDTANYMIEHLNPEQQQTADLVFKYIVSIFPEEIAHRFVFDIFENRRGMLENLNQTNLEAINSLAQSSELIQTLADLNVSFTDHPSPARKAFPENMRAQNLQVDTASTSWFALKYRDEMNLVSENGKIYPGTPFYNSTSAYHHHSWLEFGNGEKTSTFDHIVLETPDNQLRFVNPETGEYHPQSFPISKGGQFHTTTFNGKRYVVIGDSGFYNYLRSRNSVVKIYDFETGALFNPAPELGTICGMWGDLIGYNSPQRSSIGYTPEGTHSLDKDPARGPIIQAHENKIRFYINGTLVHEREYPIPDQYKTDADKQRYLNWFKGYAPEYQNKLIELEQGGNKFYLLKSRLTTEYFVPEGADLLENGTVHNQINNIKSLQTLEMENIVYSEDGEEVFRLASNEKVIGEYNIDGRVVLRVVRYNGPALHDEEDEYISDYKKLEEWYHIDLNGERVEEDVLKRLPPIKFGTKKRDFGRGEIPPIEGDSWKISFKYGKTKGDKPKDTVEAQIINKATNNPLFLLTFSKITYLPEKGVWECVTFRDDLGNSDLSFITGVKKHIYIDSKGNRVGIQEIGRLDQIYGYKEKVRLTLEKPFSAERTAEINRVIAGYEDEDRTKIEKFLINASPLSEISEEAFHYIAPILIRVDFVDPELLNEERIMYLQGRLREFNPDTQVVFFNYLSQLIPANKSKEEIDRFIEKFIKIFQEKIAVLPESEQKNIYETFDQVRDYEGKYLVSGWNIVRHDTPVSAQLIPETIRPLVDFLRSNEKESYGRNFEPIELINGQELTLSQLIQSKRLNETVMNHFGGTVEDLGKVVKEKTSGKKQDHIQREIIHPIYYQSLNNPYLFIRELVQNAHDAVIKDQTLEHRAVSVDIFSRDHEEISLRIEDPVGMSLQQVLNYFLIPGETTKLGDTETIGYFGQGLFTLFRGAKEVILLTSIGDGVVTKLKVVPMLDDKGMASDLKLTFSQEAGNFRGTVIERTVNSKYPEVEAAYIKNATCTYTSLVDSGVVDIELNQDQINRPQQELASINIPGLGELAIYDAPNNVVTQRGLFVKPLDKDYATGMVDVESLLSKRGYVLSIPDQIRLTRSRNEVARRQEFLSEIGPSLATLKLKAYLEIFRQDILKGHVIQLENLPYDYFSGNSGDNRKAVEDAQKLRRGEPLDDVSNYFERGDLIQLLVHLPVIELNNQTYSLAELKEAARNGKPPLENRQSLQQIPEVIRKHLEQGVAEYHEQVQNQKKAEAENRKVGDFALSEWKNQPEFLRKQIEADLPGLEAMNSLSEYLNSEMASRLGLKVRNTDVNTTYYYEPGSIAHASSNWGIIGWNLQVWSGYNLKLFTDNSTTDARIGNYLGTYSHEFGHIIERSGEMTHNQSFYRKQATVLAHIMDIIRKTPGVDKAVDLISVKERSKKPRLRRLWDRILN